MTKKEQREAERAAKLKAKYPCAHGEYFKVCATCRANQAWLDKGAPQLTIEDVIRKAGQVRKLQRLAKSPHEHEAAAAKAKAQALIDEYPQVAWFLESDQRQRKP